MGSTMIHSLRWTFRWLLAVIVVVISADVALAQTGPTIVQVEEDWELVIENPDSGNASPQIHCVISPVDNVESLHSTLELNHHNTFESGNVEVFAPGGMQFEVWEGKEALREKRFPIHAILSTPGEVITWTQAMTLENNSLTFEIKNGQSTTWGQFGGQGYLKPYPVQTKLADLSGYSPDHSVANSGISYAANRVKSLTLKRVRVTFSNGETVEDTTLRVVHLLD